MEKIFVTDYDNTFYTNDKDIKKNIDKVNKFRELNNIFVIATGRAYENIIEEINKFNIKYDYLIINHGSTIINNKNEIIENHTIENSIQDSLISNLDIYDNNNFFCCTSLTNYYKQDMYKSHIIKDLTKIHKAFSSLDTAKKVNEKLNFIYKDKIITHIIEKYNAIEIISSQVNKSKAIKKIANILDIPSNNIYTIGDSYNDIEMIKDFSGACMKNSILELKNITTKEYNSVSDYLNEIME